MLPHSCKECGGVEPEVRFQRRESGNLRPICEGCRGLQNIPRLYGISVEQYQAMLVAQDNSCAICGVKAWDMNHRKSNRLVVDHDHVTGKVRGLLCPECNMALGKFNDDVGRLASAIRYLTHS